MANMTKIKHKRDFERRANRRQCFLNEVIHIEASQGHKVRDWNVSRYGRSPVLATEAECSEVWFFFFFPMGAATTVGLS